MESPARSLVRKRHPELSTAEELHRLLVEEFERTKRPTQRMVHSVPNRVALERLLDGEMVRLPSARRFALLLGCYSQEAEHFAEDYNAWRASLGWMGASTEKKITSLKDFNPATLTDRELFMLSARINRELESRLKRYQRGPVA